MPTAELQTETANTQGSGSGVRCEAYDGDAPAITPCDQEARYWLEFYRTQRLVAICARHASEWRAWATKNGVSPRDWAIYPMRGN